MEPALLKFIYSEKASGDFAKFCGFLRIYELAFLLSAKENNVDGRGILEEVQLET